MGKGIIAGGAGGSSEELIHQLISVHNADAEAHEPIRNSISTVESTAQNAVQVANSRVFTAVYGTTTLAEIKTAYESGATVLCTRSDNSVKYILTGLTSTTAYFMGLGSSSNILYRVYVDTEWHAASFTSASKTEVTTAQTTAESKAPMYTYGTDDLTAGTSPLTTGQLHFVYE